MIGDIGMLWMMDAKLGLDDNVRLALEFYERKYGTKATVLNANPDDLAEARVIHGLRAVPVVSCNKGCLFVGRHMEEK